VEAPVDSRLDGDRQALIEELRAQRDAAVREADGTHAEAGSDFPQDPFRS